MKDNVKKLKLFGFITFLLLSLCLWHISLMQIMPGTKYAEVLRGMILLADFYLAISLLYVLALFGIFRHLSGGIIGRIVFILLLVVTVLLWAVRVTDWGAVYFSGKRVDSIFWYHAFYVDGTSFIFTRIAAIVFSTVIVWMVIYAKLIAAFIKGIPGYEKDFADNTKANLLALAVLFVFINLPLPFTRALTDDKDKRQYVELPEVHVIGSFIDYATRPDKFDSFVLDTAVVDKLKKTGVQINPDNDFPMMKPSIYLDPESRDSDKPVLPANTNVIIVFLESFNGVFLKEDLHGYTGLTPNLHEVQAQSLSFTKMYSAAYPTERGMIAILGSSLYNLDRIRGTYDKLKPPIPCKFLLLSDVLKTLGYTNVHIKGGSGLFGGLKNSFEKKQSYDKFYAWESVELQMYIKGHRKKGWGIRDDDVFDFTSSMLRDNKIQQPFLLTVNSLDMHPPYDPTHTHPNAKGSTLLNTIYSSDTGFGVFWKYFKDSPYRDNTVLIVTTDHPMGVGSGLKQFFEQIGYDATSPCDVVPFFVLLPGDNPWNGKMIDTVCSNLDVTPTLLDMMNVDVKNPFLGLSVFSERAQYPLAITNFYTVNYPPVQSLLSPEQKAKIDSIGWTEEDQSAFNNYTKKVVLNRILYPEKDDAGTVVVKKGDIGGD